jgi:hypothetical protein
MFSPGRFLQAPSGCETFTHVSVFATLPTGLRLKIYDWAESPNPVMIFEWRSVGWKAAKKGQTGKPKLKVFACVALVTSECGWKEI